MSDVSTCRDCGAAIRLGSEKALSGDIATVWVDSDGAWTCLKTGDEHEPGEPRRSVEVTVKHGDRETMIRLSLAEFGNFVVRPINEATDDGEAAWDLQASDSGRLDALTAWAQGLYRVTR